MTWVDNNGEVRPQSWEEYCDLLERKPWWMRSQRLVLHHVYESEEDRGLRIRERMFRADPRCFWCGRKTRLSALHATPDQATVDHLYSRLHPQRPVRHRRANSVLHVLACYECNHARGVCEQQQRSFIPALPEKLEYAQLADATLARGPVRKALQQQPEARRPIWTIGEALEFARRNPAR